MSGIVQSSDRSDVTDTSVAHATVSVTTTQTELKASGTRNVSRQSVLIYNAGTSTIYVGGNGVTASGSTVGLPILKQQVLTIPIGDVAIYAIVSTGTNNVFVMELA